MGDLITYNEIINQVIINVTKSFVNINRDEMEELDFMLQEEENLYEVSI